MALTRAQILTLYVRTVDPSVLVTRLLQIYNAVGAGMKATIWNSVKSDLLAALNTKKSGVETEKSSNSTAYDADLADYTSKIKDVTASVP